MTDLTAPAVTDDDRRRGGSMTIIAARVTECHATAHPHDSGLSYTVALTVQINAGNLTRIDITRPITISQEAVE